MRIALIGPRAAGKTSVGQRLAHRLNVNFIDLDDRAAAQFDEPTVESIWAAHGEQAWRAAELRALRSILENDRIDCVIALGGGAPMIPEAQMLLRNPEKSDLQVVYLHCSAETLRSRLSKARGDRPSLTGKSVTDEVAEVLAAREPTYRALADHVVAAANTADQVAEAILRVLKRT